MLQVILLAKNGIAKNEIIQTLRGWSVNEENDLSLSIIEIMDLVFFIRWLERKADYQPAARKFRSGFYRYNRGLALNQIRDFYIRSYVSVIIHAVDGKTKQV